MTLAEHGLDTYLQNPIPVKVLIGIWKDNAAMDAYWDLGFCRNVVDVDFVMGKSNREVDIFILFFADESILQLIGNYKQKCYVDYREYRKHNRNL